MCSLDTGLSWRVDQNMEGPNVTIAIGDGTRLIPTGTAIQSSQIEE
jgi:hypothetical protein